MPRRVAFCFALPLLVAASAAAKEGMTATLLGSPKLSAPAGTKIRIAFKFGTTSARAATTCRSDPNRFYVRLLSKTGARSTYGDADACGRRMVATVRIPRGGARAIEIKLRGWIMYPGGAMKRADALIPITNDPFAKPGKAAKAG
jgi:hypothetical protein